MVCSINNFNSFFFFYNLHTLSLHARTKQKALNCNESRNNCLGLIDLAIVGGNLSMSWSIRQWVWGSQAGWVVIWVEDGCGVVKMDWLWAGWRMTVVVGHHCSFVWFLLAKVGLLDLCFRFDCWCCDLIVRYGFEAGLWLFALEDKWKKKFE